MGIETAEDDGLNLVTPEIVGDTYSYPQELAKAAVIIKGLKQDQEQQNSTAHRAAQLLSTAFMELGVFSPNVRITEDRTLMTGALVCQPLYIECMKECGVDPTALTKLLPRLTLEIARYHKLNPLQRLHVARFIIATRGLVTATAESLVNEAALPAPTPPRSEQQSALSATDLIALGISHIQSPIRLTDVIQNARKHIESSHNPVLDALIKMRPHYFTGATALSHLTPPIHTPIQAKV